MTHFVGNLFSDIPGDLPDECVQQLAGNPHVRIERIVSAGHASPPGFWYDQDEQEWVMVLQGEAKLSIQASEAALADGGGAQSQPQPKSQSQLQTRHSVVVLKAGDQLLIPAHQKHRVEWTSASEPTIWLAVFFSPEDPGPPEDLGPPGDQGQPGDLGASDQT
ncbi:cupin domain-containing protein [Neorhodopirellula lusitana]|uniref:hypothetical protein n=1 Tax=Neorhodopirellula lusitana TaxID=445327 RepID=UPI00384C2066